MENKKFRLELFHYIKPNTTKSFTGMPCFGMNIPTPISYLAPYLIKFLNMNKLSKKKDLDLLKKQTPPFVIISTKNDEPNSWIKTGMIYEEIALMAQKNNINTAMLASAIQIKDYYKDLQKTLKTNFRPQAFFRLGYAIKETPHSPRLPADKIIF
jgi:hypothetical protein